MINNRQGGRRRGRGGQRGPNIGGNRQDNRQRGNAAQLLEKYKNMARDAQLSGDRVQSEYFLQFAEHYFRVLGENRPRSDDQRRERADNSSDDDGNDSDSEETASEASNDDSDGRGGKRSRGNSRERSDDSDRPARNGSRSQRGQVAANVDEDEDEERIAVDVLPPAIGREADDGEEAPAKPKRRTRKPRNDSDEVAPAA